MTTSVRPEPEIEAWLDALAARTRRTKANLRELIQRGIEDIEDYYLADAAMERLRKGEERVYSSKEIREDLGLDD